MPETNSHLLELPNLFRTLVKKMSHEWYRNMGDTFSMTQFRTLYMLNERGPQKAAELADLLCVTSGAITGLADKLIEKGLVGRERSEDDRRVVYLRITDPGKQVLEELREKQKETIARLFEGLPEEDILHLTRIFTTLLERVEPMDKKE
ncbi:MAG: MarR family transcriptional regulator [Paenibacillus sp.]|jgi:DNA-binding MarR family transcriptional regulator|uniref:MarR family winged helix-turn-helix transcriptional regulator n=1 Tax=Paenibacillus sp. GCM10012303 TaxID=3317340 RepID=UPI0029F0E9C9|nr:MarR family transcriptional regulator [Paenibacillus sp.]